MVEILLCYKCNLFNLTILTPNYPLTLFFKWSILEQHSYFNVIIFLIVITFFLQFTHSHYKHYFHVCSVLFIYNVFKYIHKAQKHGMNKSSSSTMVLEHIH